MANHKSALKRSRQNLKRRARNKAVRTRVRGVVREVRGAAEEKAVETAGQKMIEAQSVIDKAAKKGVLHKRTAARKISRLSKLVNTIAA